MYYALVGILSLLVLVITNYDVFFVRKKDGAGAVQKYYLRFLLSVSLYYVTDILWGAFEAFSLTLPLFIVTEVYFVSMALGVLAWTQYVVAYLQERNRFRKNLSMIGLLFFAGVSLLAFLNLFLPVIFRFDHEGVYHAYPARDIILLIQVLLLLWTSAYTLHVSTGTQGARKNRHFAIAVFGLVMLVFIAVQFFQPYLPLYGIGYLLGCCLLRAFVVENEKEEYRQNLETALEREKKELEELSTAWKLAYTDAMTGAGSRLAFAEAEDHLERAISEGTAVNLAVVVFDVNGLKQINDREGHEAGDRYIISAFSLITDIFRHSPVFRVGGDEFAAILREGDYEQRRELLELFNRRVDENRASKGVMVAAGCSEYRPGEDGSFRHIFARADDLMYSRKKEMKQRKD